MTNPYMEIAIRTYLSSRPSDELPIIEAEAREVGYFRRLFIRPVRCSARDTGELDLQA